MVRNAAWRRSLLCVLALSLGFASPPCEARIYTNHWAVRIAGGPEVAEHIAQKYGYRNMGQVSHPRLLPKVASGLCWCVLHGSGLQTGAEQRPWSRMARQVPLPGLPLRHLGDTVDSQLSPWLSHHQACLGHLKTQVLLIRQVL